MHFLFLIHPWLEPQYVEVQQGGVDGAGICNSVWCSGGFWDYLAAGHFMVGFSIISNPDLNPNRWRLSRGCWRRWNCTGSDSQVSSGISDNPWWTKRRRPDTPQWRQHRRLGPELIPLCHCWMNCSFYLPPLQLLDKCLLSTNDPPTVQCWRRWRGQQMDGFVATWMDCWFMITLIQLFESKVDSLNLW